MYRLLLPLCLMLACGVIAVILFLNMYFNSEHIDKIGHEVAFNLLDKQMQNSSNLPQTLTELKSQFFYKLELKKIASIDEFDAHHKQLIRNGEPLIIDIDDAYFLYQLSTVLADHVWVVQTEQTEEDSDHYEAIGPFNLATLYLESYPVEQWQEKVAELNANTRLPFFLKPLSEVMAYDLPPEKQQQLLANRVLFDLLPNDRSYHYRVADSDWVIVAGPLPLRWWQSYWAFKNANWVVLLIFSVFMVTAIQFWIRPLWKSLWSLHSAAQQFGEGKFDTRIPLKRFSTLRPIFASFNAMAGRIQALISSHKELTNAVSHELRTPLARMRFGLEELVNASNDEQKQYFHDQVTMDINELDALVNEMLVYASFERVQPEIAFSATPLIPWLNEQLDRAKSMNPSRDYQLDTSVLKPSSHASFESKLTVIIC